MTFKVSKSDQRVHKWKQSCCKHFC